MKKVKNFFVNLWNDESAQGMTEYILLAVVLVGIVMIFKERIKTALETKLSDLQSKIQSVE